MIWIISYIIPIILGCVCVWIDMEKGQTVAEYLDEGDGFFDEELIPLLIIMFVPAINLITLFITIPFLVFNLVKDIRK